MKVYYFERFGRFYFYCYASDGTRTKLCDTPDEAKRLVASLDDALRDAEKKKHDLVETFREWTLDWDGEVFRSSDLVEDYIIVSCDEGSGIYFVVFRVNGEPVPGVYFTQSAALDGAKAVRNKFQLR